MPSSLVLDGDTLRTISYLFFALSGLYAVYLAIRAWRDRQAGEAGSGLEAWSLQMDEAEGYPAGHGARVAAHALAIGERYGLEDETLEALRVAGLLHDIGQVGMGFVAQPGALTAEETTLLWEHPVIGEQWLVAQGYDEAGAMVRHHHERWDGGGYPDRLRGEAIPLPARILAVADAFEAFQHDRPYRQGFDAEVARDEIRRRAGTAYDPQVVQVFLSLQEEETDFQPAAVEF